MASTSAAARAASNESGNRLTLAQMVRPAMYIGILICQLLLLQNPTGMHISTTGLVLATIAMILVLVGLDLKVRRARMAKSNSVMTATDPVATTAPRASDKPGPERTGIR